ncbi:MAG: anti-sigma F factor [Bacillota bacterium]|jgi:stage II sporulation protein AB (anti-sigma F factor)|nr:anti-sigma F factor [Clostridia bacterium]
MDAALINSVNLQFKSIPENVSLARVVVASIGAQVDMTVNELDEIKVAVSEAVTNAIIHGYNNNPSQIVELQVDMYHDRLVIQVIDRGIGIGDVNKELECIGVAADYEHMGLGFAFMKEFMDDVEINSEQNKGTRITMVKKLVFRKES